MLLAQVRPRKPGKQLHSKLLTLSVQLPVNSNINIFIKRAEMFRKKMYTTNVTMVIAYKRNHGYSLPSFKHIPDVQSSISFSQKRPVKPSLHRQEKFATRSTQSAPF